jgi:hypothetical protein
MFSLIARLQISSPEDPGSRIILGSPEIFSPSVSVMRISEVWSNLGETSFFSIVINIFLVDLYIFLQFR